MLPISLAGRLAVLLLSPLLLARCAAGPEPTDVPPPDRTSASAAAPAAPPAPSPTAAPLVADTLPDLPDGFVRLADVAPAVAQEMRYATPYNFVGAPIDGYVAPTCILAREAAEALARVATDLAADGLGLKVYDCYRPQTAVNHFARWARGSDDAMKRAFYPDEPRGELFRRGYIAYRSGHSRGATVDLTLVRQPATARVVTQYPDPAAGPLPRCDQPLGGPDGRFPEGDLDMGTGWDCLSPRSATASTAVSAEARRNRQTLVRAMSRRGFRNYSKEWWHFTFRPEPFPSTHFDFPVE